MYATNDNSQAIESRNRVSDALLALMKQYPYKSITITQICQEAQIVRQTYYRNFDTKDDILKFHLDTMVEQFFTDYYQADDAYVQLKNFFSYMLQHSDFLLSTSENSLFYMINETIQLNIKKFLNLQQLATIGDPRFKSYVTGFISSTICSLLSLWVDSGFTETPEILAQLAQRFLRGVSTEEDR